MYGNWHSACICNAADFGAGDSGKRLCDACLYDSCICAGRFFPDAGQYVCSSDHKYGSDPYPKERHFGAACDAGELCGKGGSLYFRVGHYFLWACKISVVQKKIGDRNMNWRNLFWAECRKLRRSKMILIAVAAVFLTAGILFVGGLEVYHGLEVHYGLKVMRDGMRYLENAGWYMDEMQPWAFFFVIPGMTALFGSYLSVREQEEDTMKSLRLIPLQEIDLMRVKMILTLLFSIGLSMLCFGITFLTEAVLHIEDLSASFVFMLWKEYVLGGIGIFFAVFPIIAFAAGRQKNCWSVFLFTEIYSVFGLFAGMADRVKDFYPITAVFNVSGYQIASMERRMISAIVLLLCGCLGIFWIRKKCDMIRGEKRNGTK